VYDSEVFRGFKGGKNRLLNQLEHDQFFIKYALKLAARALGRTSPNPVVGAVVVKDGRIVGEGYHQKAGTPHAEIHALQQAGEIAKGATLYVTLEPCSHFGRTPPCTQAIIKAGIGRVVAAMVDPNPEVAGQGLILLDKAGIQVECGILEDEAGQLNEVFIKFITTRLPFVVMKSAMTWDGKTATKTGHSQWITGHESRAEVHRMRDRYDAIMVGIGTVLADDPQLTTRLPDGKIGKDPLRVVVDSFLRLPLEARVINQVSTAPTLVATTSQASIEHKRVLEERGVQVITLDSSDGRVDLKALMVELGQRQICGVLLEGGAALNASALKAGIVDKVVTFIAPKIVGGREAPGVVGGEGKVKMDEAWMLEKLNISQFGEDLMLTGYVKKDKGVM
jgi:diaminohydroxyphosphoribosylaminopyrimidine deaminase/5-amino-6-(5-phosphoribosylamino)uracil reductase